MPLVTVELPSGQVQKVVIEGKTTLKQVALMLELKPENVVFYQFRYNGKLGTIIGPASDREFEDFNTDSIVIVDKTVV